MRVERDDLSGIERLVWAMSYGEALKYTSEAGAWDDADARVERLRDEAQRRELEMSAAVSGEQMPEAAKLGNDDSKSRRGPSAPAHGAGSFKCLDCHGFGIVEGRDGERICIACEGLGYHVD